MLLNAPFLIEGKQTREVEILEEVVFYGGRKGKRDPRGKEKEKMIKGKGGSGDQSKGKGNLDQRGHWKKEKKKEVFGKEGEGGFFEDQDHQGFLDSCSV
jgi:hypothetical protein